MALKVSVIICTFNRCNLLRNVLESIVTQTADKNDYEILVIDNNSSDSTKQICTDFEKNNQNFQYIHEPRQGLSNARNTGYQQANADYVAYIDDDALAFPDWVSEIIAFTRRKPEIVAFGGPYYRYSDKTIPNWLPENYGEWNLGNLEKKIEIGVEWINGTNMIFKKSVLELLGGFNTNIGMNGNSIGYGEETHLLIQLHNLTKEVYYSPHIKVKHYVANKKLTFIWHLKSIYGDGKTTIITWDIQTKKKKLRIQLWREVKKTIKLFLFSDLKPFKYRILEALRGTISTLGQIKGFKKQNETSKF